MITFLHRSKESPLYVVYLKSYIKYVNYSFFLKLSADQLFLNKYAICDFFYITGSYLWIRTATWQMWPLAGTAQGYGCMCFQSRCTWHRQLCQYTGLDLLYPGPVGHQYQCCLLWSDPRCHPQVCLSWWRPSVAVYPTLETEQIIFCMYYHAHDKPSIFNYVLELGHIYLNRYAKCMNISSANVLVCISAYNP